MTALKLLTVTYFVTTRDVSQQMSILPSFCRGVQLTHISSSKPLLELAPGLIIKYKLLGYVLLIHRISFVKTTDSASVYQRNF